MSNSNYNSSEQEKQEKTAQHYGEQKLPALMPPLNPPHYVFLNDAQPPVWDADAKAWRCWALINLNAKFPPKRQDNFNRVDGGTEWGEWLLSEDFTRAEWIGIRLPQGKQCDGDKLLNDIGSVATGSCVLFQGKVWYFASCGEGMRSVGLWIADKLGTKAQYQDIVLQGEGEFRDPRVSVQDDGSLLMVIAADEGIQFHRSDNGLNWDYLSTVITGAKGLVECPQFLQNVQGASLLLFGANGMPGDDGKPQWTPRSYCMSGDFDGRIFTPCKTSLVNYGDSFYGAVLFAKPDNSEWYLASWTEAGTWKFAANINRPDTQGVVRFCYADIIGSGGERQISSRPIWDKKQWLFDHFKDSNDAADPLDYTGDYTNLPCRDMPDEFIARFWIDADLEKGEHIRLTDGSGDAKHKYGGLVLEKTDGGFTLTCGNYGTLPNWDIKSYQSGVFIPLPATGKTDIFLEKTRGGATFYVGDGSGAYNAATITVNFPLGAQELALHFNTAFDKQNTVIKQNHYKGNFSLRSDSAAGQKAGGFRKEYADDLYLDINTPVITSFDSPAEGEQTGELEMRIRQITLDTEKGLLLRRAFGDTFDKAYACPTLPQGSAQKGNGTAVISLAASDTVEQVQIIGWEKATSPNFENKAGSQIEVSETAMQKPDRAFLESAGGKSKLYLLTDTELQSIIEKRLVQTFSTDSSYESVSKIAVKKNGDTPFFLTQSGRKIAVQDGAGKRGVGIAGVQANDKGDSFTFTISLDDGTVLPETNAIAKQAGKDGVITGIKLVEVTANAAVSPVAEDSANRPSDIKNTQNNGGDNV